MKTNKVLKFELSITEVMKNLELHKRINKNHEYHETSFENYENYENLRIPLQNY